MKSVAFCVFVYPQPLVLTHIAEKQRDIQAPLFGDQTSVMMSSSSTGAPERMPLLPGQQEQQQLGVNDNEPVPIPPGEWICDNDERVSDTLILPASLRLH